MIRRNIWHGYQLSPRNSTKLLRSYFITVRNISFIIFCFKLLDLCNCLKFQPIIIYLISHEINLTIIPFWFLLSKLICTSQSTMLLFLLPSYLSNPYLMTFCCLLLILTDSSFLFLAVSKLGQNTLYIYILDWDYRKVSSYLSTISSIASQSEYFVSRKAICH